MVNSKALHKGGCFSGDTKALITSAFSPASDIKHSTTFKHTCFSKQSGFTLVEMLVVVSILGLMLMIGSGSWTGVRSSEQVKSAAEKIRSAMAASRIKALSTGRQQYVGIDIYSDAIASTIEEASVYSSGSNTWSASTLWEETKGVDILDSETDGTAPSSPVTTQKNFTFEPRGVTSSNNENCVLIKSLVGSASIGKIIIVNEFTGKVRIEDCTAAGKSCR